MLTLLVIGTAAVSPATPNPQVEILRSREIEEGLEILARNRRIDAILIAAGQLPLPIISAISEEISAPPPVFVACGDRSAPAGSRAVSEDPDRAIDQICRELQ